MKRNDKLFLLIKSLNKSEKRFFKIYSARHVIGDQNKYVQLFDVIDRQKTYNEAVILKKFANEKFSKRLAVAKSYLYELILKSMNNYHAQHSLDGQIRERLGHVSFLYHKGMDKQALKILLKVKKLILNYEQIVFLPEVLHWQKKLIEAQLYKEYPPIILQNIHQEEQAYLQKLQNINDYWLLQAKVYHHYHQQGFQQLAPDLIETQALLKDETQALTLQARLFAYKTHAIYYFLKRDIQQCYQYSKQIIDLLENNTKLIEIDAILYVTSINNLLNMSSMLQNKSEKTYYLEKLLAMMKNKKWRTWSQLQTKLFEVYYYHQMTYFVGEAKFEEGLPLVNDLQIALKKYEPKLKKRSVAMLCFYSFHLCFGSNKFEAAYEWLQTILHYPPQEIRPDILLFTHILNLLTVYELQNPQLLKRTVQKSYRFLRGKERRFQLENIVLKLLKQLPTLQTEQQFLQLLKEIQPELLLLVEDKKESRVFAYFPFNNWVQSKVNKIPFAQTFA